MHIPSPPPPPPQPETGPRTRPPPCARPPRLPPPRRSGRGAGGGGCPVARARYLAPAPCVHYSASGRRESGTVVVARCRCGEGLTTMSVTLGINQLPRLAVPEDYPRVMPSLLARMAQGHGPIFRRDWGPGESIVYLVGPEANKLVLPTHRDCFSHDLGWTPILCDFLGKGLLNTDDPVHAIHRRMMNPAFTIAHMSRYLPVMQRVIVERTRDWPQRGVVDGYQEPRRITFAAAAE